jgi:hypothetical protein
LLWQAFEDILSECNSSARKGSGSQRVNTRKELLSPSHRLWLCRGLYAALARLLRSAIT